MPTTRKKVIKAVYKDEDSDGQGDFSDSGSDAKFSAESSSEDEEPIESEKSSGDEFHIKEKSKQSSRKVIRKPKFAKTLINKINKQTVAGNESANVDVTPALFTVKDLTEADKLLPPILNLSESDSSDDESPRPSNKKTAPIILPLEIDNGSNSDNEVNSEYKDVWSTNIQDNSEEIAKRTFMELEQHNSNIAQTKATLQSYAIKLDSEKESNVKDLLALGEDVLPEQKIVKKKSKTKNKRDESDSEMEDWEEVNESKEIPQQGIQLFVEFPDMGCRKSKKLDVEMMMKRKINRVKKEYQVYMHKVHVLCWLAHGNYVSRILNDQELLSAALSLVPSKECYPGERVDMKYVEQITTWYKDKLTLKQDKNEDKFKPKAPPLLNTLTDQIKSRVVTTRKYLVFIFVSMLRALGLQCRVMFNFVALPIKPPTSELCSLSTKAKGDKSANEKTKLAAIKQEGSKNSESKKQCTKVKKLNVSQIDGNDDYYSTDTSFSSFSDFEYILQVDGNNDPQTVNTRKTRSAKRATANDNNKVGEEVSPPKIPKRNTGHRSPKPTAEKENKTQGVPKKTQKRKINESKESQEDKSNSNNIDEKSNPVAKQTKTLTRRLKSQIINEDNSLAKPKAPEENITASNPSKIKSSRSIKTIPAKTESKLKPPKITVTTEDREISSEYFDGAKSTGDNKKLRLSRKRSQTANPGTSQSENKIELKQITKQKCRTKSAPGNATEKSKYFAETTPQRNKRKSKDMLEDKQRVSHRDLAKTKPKAKNDVTGDLVDIIKNRIKHAKEESKRGIVKGKIKEASDEDSDHLPVEDLKRRKSESDDDFKPTKISPKPSTSRKIDRRVLTPVVEVPSKKIDVWCEIFVEELEQWISVDVIKGKIYNANDFYTNATHPVCYIVGWDNNNYLKDLTRRYVPQWNTVTRKLRAETVWWDKAVQPWLGPKTARDREEDENLDRMQLEAPLPKSIAEYKNHPLYALKRHLLKFEAIYPADAAVLGFVRGEAVYARECVHVCRSRDTWLKEAKVVKLGEKPYKVVKARPKWDKLSNKMITDKPLEVFGPWQVKEYEPPVAENGIVPRNAYGNVELFKECMLPKGTVHLKLPSLNRVAKKLNIDCAPAMTGFDFNGGWSHPVYDGFVVCEEFAEIITDAWVKDQEEQERREQEKMEARVYGNWRRLIKGLLIKERLKFKYGFDEPTISQPPKSKSKGPKLVVKKRS